MKLCARKIGFVSLTLALFQIQLLADIPDDHYKTCPSILRRLVNTSNKDTWRNDVTHKTTAGAMNETDETREKTMELKRSSMTSFIHNDNDVPEMWFSPIPGVNFNRTTPVDDVTIPRYEVSGPKVSNGILKGTLLLPVSGHLGIANARKWKDTDTYTLYVVDSKGKRTDLVKDAKSLDFVTHHELEIPLEKGKMVSLYYHRSGSGGPSGYPEGRTIELIWK